MACCHKVMLLLDTAGGAVLQTPARRAALRLLTYLGCRFGLARVHWAFKFFDSRGARGRASRASDFRELGPRSWEDFEAELEARLGGPAPGAALPDPAPRASHTHGALMETLLDYQWDRPEIASPAKPILRSRGRRLLDAESEARETEAALGGLANAVFLLAPCPHSQRELARFVSGCEAQRPPPTPQQVMEKLLPRTVREVMVARKITLYWVDITARPKLWESPDHVGYWTICELLHHGGGTVLPPETFSWGLTKAGETMLEGEAKMSSEPHLSPWISALPTDATLNYLLYNSAVYEASFPRTEGALFLPVKGKEIQETWTVTLEPLAMYQRHFQNPVRIFLKGSVAQWSLPMSGTLGTDSWMLQSPEENRLTQGLLFQQLVSSLMAEELHLVASVDPGEGWPPVTGILSPLSASALILTVFHAKEAEFQGHYLQTVVAEGPQDTVSLFSDVTDGVLNQIHRLFEDAAASAPPVPEWAQQELSCTKPWSPAVLEKWFTFSNISGASSNLMESFWLLQAASANKEQSSKTESELTHRLSELYKRKSRKESTVANQEDTKKKRGIPRTPVRQKMNTMCRSLKMLNVARLNVKAQKLHPDGSPDAAGEKAIQKTVGGRTADKLEDRGRALKSSKPKDFKTEEELLSYIHENYQKTVATAEIPLHSCARNMISTIKVFLKSKGTKEVEVNCLNHIKSDLLKTSKSLRQNLGKKLDKEDAVRECQLQVFLHLEMCLQCPSILENPDEMEQVVDEITALLRIVCRTEDSAYVPHFLEEILKLYTDSIPETLGKLYNSLGLEIPPKLAGVLPPDFFSDDSMTQESKSPLSVPLPSSAHRSMSGSTEADQLEELRTKSAKKRKNALVRHKSLAEVSQNLRQIEIPQVSKRTTKSESLHPAPQQPALPAKGTAQEVTKVRRNLFNQEMISPSKRSLKRGLPRSHSVSALEDLDRKCDNIKKTKSTTFRGYHKLLTKSVAETPVHKQISRRLLHRQIKGRSSDPGPDISVVEESPEKGEGEISLRRSPRIKQLSFSRTNSGSFYSVSQPKSRSVQRVHSFQQNKSDQRENSPIQSIRSPRSLLFGTVPEMVSPSEKGSARIKRLSRSKLSSETPAAYQTPKKSYQKSPTFPKTIPRGFPRTPQIPPHTPEGPLHPAAEVPPAEPALAEKALQDPSSPSCCSPSASRATPQEGPSPAEGASALAPGTPRTPTRPGAQPPGFMLNSAWPHLVNSSPENPYRPASPTPSAAQPWSKCVTPVRHCLRTPPRAAALLGPPQGQKYQQLLLPEVSQAEEPAQILKDKAVQTPERPGDITVTSSPLRAPEKWGVSKSPLRRPSTVSPGLRDLDQKEHQASPSRATSPSCAAPSVSPTTVPPRGVASVTTPPPPPSKLGRWNRRASDPKQGSLECPPGPAAALGVATVTSPASTTGSRKDQEEGSPSPPSCPEGQRHLGAGASSDWPGSSPLLVGSDTDYLTVLEEAESQGGGSHAVRGGEGTGLRTADHAWKPPSVPNTRTSPPAPCSGPGSPEMESCALHCPGGQCQAMARPESLRVPVRPLNAPASSQTYEVELEMRASGLPKLRIKKVDSNTLTEAEVPGKEGSPVGEEASLPGLSMPRASRATSKPEATYVSPPCLHFLHSTPGKGQTYICQSCTPTHCPPSTPSPFQTDVGVPWTPSPKHNGKTTPDSIKDWPRRKRAVDCSNGHPSGRGEVGGDPLGALPLPEPQAREQALKLSLHKTPISEDFELEGVCQLPDQSPPGDSVPKAEEAFSWGQFGLGSRKRHWSPKEEAECGAKRVCEAPREDADMRKHEKGASGWTVPQLPSTGDDEVFASGCTPPPGCALRSCLSASGLQALTQSPLLLPGKAASSECLNPTDENADVFPSAAEASTFSPAISRRRPFSRTYTRKKLIS